MPPPVSTSLSTGGTRPGALSHTGISGGPGIDLQLRGDPGALQGQVHQQAVLRRADDVLTPVCQEDWRGVGWNADPSGQFILIFGLKVARINGNGEVGPATDVVNLIDPFIRSPIE